MSGQVIAFPIRTVAPAYLRVVVFDSREHGCPQCALCDEFFKMDLGYWPFAQNENEARPICLDCGGIANLPELSRELDRLQNEFWQVQQDGARVTRLEIPWPGGVITVDPRGWVHFVRTSPPKRRAAR